MKKWILFASIALVCMIAAGMWYFILTKDRREVRALVVNTVELISKKPDNLPHAGIFKHARVDELFDETVSFRIAKPPMDITLPREDLKSRVAILLRMVDSIQTGVENINADVVGEQAVFAFEAQVSGKGKGKIENFAEVYHCSGTAVKRDGKWRVSSLIAEPVVK